MLDAQQLAKTVEQEIRAEVQRQVSEAVSQTAWIESLEQQIVSFVQDRITARFSNIGTLPDLVDTVEQKVGDLFANGFVPDLANYVDQPRIRQSVDLAVERFVENTIDALTVDPVWMQKIENLLVQRTQEKIQLTLRDINLQNEISKTVMANQKALIDAMSKNFRTAGIADTASSLQLSVMDDVVVIEKETVTQDLTVEHDALIKGDVLIQGSIGIQGRINVDNETWHELSDHVGRVTYDRVKNEFAKELTDNMLSTVKQGIEIENITVGGQSLISNDTLSSGVTKSSLQQLGTLDSINVVGTSRFAQTLNVVKGRVGVNTHEPDSALSLWDEETNVSIGKLSKNTSFVGSSRKQNLAIGVNRQNHIEIDSEGLTTIQQLKVGRHRVSWGTEVPGYSGTKGDIVFNINANDGIFAWVCLGAFRWQTVRMSQ